jgi:hypothetical protein
VVLKNIPARRFDYEYRIWRKRREQVMIQNIARLSGLDNLMSELIEACRPKDANLGPFQAQPMGHLSAD